MNPGEHVTTVAGFELDGETTPVRELARQLWESRRLLAMLARKDFFVRYRRAAFGLSGAVGLPLFQAMVLAVIFSRVARIHVHGSSYVTFVFAGMVAWSYFSTTLSTGATSIVDGADLSTKIYFPRAVLPLVSATSNLYGLLIGVVLLIGVCLVTGTSLGIQLLLLVPAIALIAVFTASLTLVLSALHVYFRDMRYIVMAALMAWLYLTPVIYPLDKVPGLAPWLRLNPTTGVVELFRAATVGADSGWHVAIVWTCVWTAVLAVIAMLLHRRFNRVFVDLL